MRKNMTPLNARMSDLNNVTQQSSLLMHMASYMPALTPVIVRQRNNSRLFATPTPERHGVAMRDSDNDSKEVRFEEGDPSSTPPFSSITKPDDATTTPTAA